MKKVLKIVGMIFLVIVAFVLIAPLFIKNEFRVERSIETTVSPDAAMNYMKDFSHFEKWSPFRMYDTSAVVTIEGSPGEIGSTYAWKGDGKVGSGIMTLDSIKNNEIGIQLKFTEPWESESYTYYQFKPENDHTTITWAMEGESPYPTNIMHLFMDMDEMLGADFERGLALLKPILESLPEPENEYQIHEVNLTPRTYIGKRAIVKFQDIEQFYTDNLNLVLQELEKRKLEMAGYPSGLFFTYDMEKEESDMAAAIPVSGDNRPEGFDSWTIEGKALQVTYFGNYEGLMAPHNALTEYVESHQLELKMPAIEEYVTDPGNEADTSKWQTNIYYLIN